MAVLSIAKKRARIRAFCDSNLPYLYWCARRIMRRLVTSSRLDLDDVVGELVARLLDQAEWYNPKRGKMTTWIFWQSRHVLTKLNYQKKQSQRFNYYRRVSPVQDGTSVFDNIPAQDIDPLTKMIREETTDLVRGGLVELAGALPKSHYTVRKCLVDGWGVCSVASLLKVNKEVIRRRVIQGKRFLADSLKPLEEFYQ